MISSVTKYVCHANSHLKALTAGRVAFPRSSYPYHCVIQWLEKRLQKAGTRLRRTVLTAPRVRELVSVRVVGIEGDEHRAEEGARGRGRAARRAEEVKVRP